jgi:hypothetical protein
MTWTTYLGQATSQLQIFLVKEIEFTGMQDFPHFKSGLRRKAIYVVPSDTVQ